MKIRLLMVLASLVALATYAGATTPTRKKATRQTNPTSHVSSTNHLTKSGTTKPSKSASSRRKSRSRTVARGRARQLSPTPDRYKEIQKALADRGYLKNEPTGTWDSDSQQAMRKFQNDQKLDPSGKITAASLIALGLGPKNESQAAASSNTSTASAPGATTSPE